jgi:hypothetical protein
MIGLYAIEGNMVMISDGNCIVLLECKKCRDDNLIASQHDIRCIEMSNLIVSSVL